MAVGENKGTRVPVGFYGTLCLLFGGWKQHKVNSLLWVRGEEIMVTEAGLLLRID